MRNEIRAYARGMGASDEVLEWCSSTLEAASRKGVAGDQTEIEHILDYLTSPKAPSRLRRMSYLQARDGADKWTRSQQKKGRNITEVEDVDYRSLHDFGDGTRIVELLTKEAYKREGHLMSHCVGGYDPSSGGTRAIYSYRDADNMPHATFEVQRTENEVTRDGTEGEITQIKGKGNGPIHPRYIDPILTFLRAIGMEIRPYDMRNLGYTHISPTLLEVLSEFQFPEGESSRNTTVTLLGERYVYEAG